MNENQLLLIDLSSLAHRLWHVSGNEPDPDYISTNLIAQVRRLAEAHPAAAICRDTGKSFRVELDPTYKAQRDTENRAPLRHQMDLACETLKRDGFPVWGVKGYEADDIIASATKEALAIDGASVLIVTADKDLLQLVNGRVSIKKVTDGTIMDADAVKEKYKITPGQMADFLALCGDTSDNIVGAKGIGAVTAAKLLSLHGSLAALYEKMTRGVVPGLTPAMRTSLQEFKDRWPLVAQLIALKDDAPIPFAEIAVERSAPPIVESEPEPMTGFVEEDSPLPPAEKKTAPAEPTKKPAEKPAEKPIEKPAPAEPRVAVLEPPSTPVDFSMQLEPRSMNEAILLAQRMYDSRLFGAYGTPQAVLATILAGRELGLPAMASLRAFHIIEDKPTLSAGIIQSLVLTSGKAKYFRCIERTEGRATFETQRGDDPPMSLSFTIEEGRRAWPRDDVAFTKSGWGKNPADMCVARAASKLARLVYPDVVSGLYAPEEFD